MIRELLINKYEWLVAFLLYLLLFPYFIWNYLGLLNWFVTIPIILLLIINKSKKTSNYSWCFFFLLIALFAGLCNRQHILGLFFTAATSLVFLVDDIFLFKVYHRFKLIYVCLITISLISALLVLLNISIPYRIIPPPSNNTFEVDFIAYPLFVKPDMLFWEYKDLRFNGLFDEPGVVGTQACLFLAIENFNLRKIGNIMILISGIFSMSLFFYVTIALYSIYKVSLNTNIRTYWKILTFIIITLAIIYTYNNPAMHFLIWDRLQWDSANNTISGNNRAELGLIDYVNNLKGTDAYLFGVGDKTIIERYNESASIYNQILKYGFISVFSYICFFVVMAMSKIKIKKNILIFIFIFVATMYTRPTMFLFVRLFMFYVLIISLRDENAINKHGLVTFRKEKTLKTSCL